MVEAAIDSVAGPLDATALYPFGGPPWHDFQRWVLKADDPRSLEDIDAVFVTVEPNGGSPHPSGKQLLFAYLRVSPNHP